MIQRKVSRQGRTVISKVVRLRNYLCDLEADENVTESDENLNKAMPNLSTEMREQSI